MAKNSKLSREEFAALAAGTPATPTDPTPGALNVDKQKQLMSQEDFERLASTRNSPDPGIEYLKPSQYSAGYLQAEQDYNRHLALRQGKLHEAANAAAQVGLNLVPGVLGNIGALDPRDWFAGINENEEEIGNALTRWANKTKQHVNEDLFPIYEQDPGKTLNLGSTEWWFKNGSSVVGSAAEFAVMGFGLGSLLTKGLAATKWLSTLDAVTGATKLTKLGQAIGVGTNAFLLNQAESILEATQVYDTELQKNMELVNQGKLTEKQARLNAASAAGHTVNLNRMNILLNLTGVSAIMKGARGSRNIISSMGLPQKVALEGGQEYLEEVVNFYATNRGFEKGEAIRTGQPYTGASISKFIDDALSAKGIEAGFLGAFGGVAQTGFIGGVNRLRGTEQEERAWIDKQKANITELNSYNEQNKLKNLRDSGVAAVEMKDLLTTRAVLEKQLQEEHAAGLPANNNLIAELQETNEKIQVAQLHFNFQMGTAEYLEKAYQDIAGLSEEDALKNGYNGAELDPKSPAYYKTTAQNMLQNLHSLEKVYNKTQDKINGLELFRLKASSLRTEKQLKQFTQQETEARADAQDAIGRLERSIGLPSTRAIDIARINDPEYEKELLDDIQNPELIDALRETLAAVKELPEVKAVNKFQHLQAMAQTELDAQKDLFAELSSSKHQDKLRKAAEVKKAETKKQLAAVQVKLKEAEQKEAAAQVQAAEKQKRIVADYKAKLKTEGISDADNDLLQAAADKVLNAPENTEVAFTTAEAEAISKHPDIYQKLVNLLKPTEVEVVAVKPDPMAFTSVDNLEVGADYTSLQGTQLPLNFKVGKDTGKPEKGYKGKLYHVNNVMAWLARNYKKLADGEIQDVDNNLNKDLKDPSILDARTLKIGDPVVLKIDNNALVTVPDANGNPVSKPWKEVSADYTNDFQGMVNIAPIGIYRKGESIPVGHVHLPSSVNKNDVDGDDAVIAEEKKKLNHIRATVINARGRGVATTISQRTYGKLFMTADKKPQPVSVNLQDSSLSYVVMYQNQFLAADKTAGDVDKIIVNHTLQNPLPNKNGYTFVLVPIEKNADPKLTKYWAVPLLINKISPEVVESIVKATEIYLRSIDGTTTDADNQAADAIMEIQKDARIKGSPINFDIRTPDGIRNYTELFIYNHTKSDQGGADHMSLKQYFMQRAKTMPGDYYAHEFSNTGLYFGNGSKGIAVANSPEDYMEQWREHLQNRYQHSELKYLNNGTVKLPVIREDNSVSELAPGNTYLEYLKQNAWQTNIMGQNIAEPGKPANYVYTIQQIIEFDTKPFTTAPAATSSENVSQDASKEEQRKQIKADWAAALKANKKLSLQDMKTKVANLGKSLKETQADLASDIEATGANEQEQDFLKTALEGIFTIEGSNPHIDGYNPKKVQDFLKYKFAEMSVKDIRNLIAKFPTFFEHVFIQHKIAYLAEKEGKSGLPENLAELNAEKINAEFQAKLDALDQPVPTSKPQTFAEIEKSNTEVFDNMFDDMPAVAAPITATEDLPGPLLKHEAAYQSLQSAYTLPYSPDFDNAMLRSLLNYWSTEILKKFNNSKEAGVDTTKGQFIFVNKLIDVLKAEQAARVSTLAPETKAHKIAKYTVENWDTIENLLKYSLQRDYGFKLKKQRVDALDEDEDSREKSLEAIEQDAADDIDNADEVKSTKEKWQEAVFDDPAKGLSAQFRRFLGGIVNPTKKYLISPNVSENFKPVMLYRSLSAILSDTDANFDVMLGVLDQWSKTTNEKGEIVPRPGFEYLGAVVEALQNADEQIKAEFVVTMSKHYVNMKHLYILTKTGMAGGKVYEGFVRDDNANAKTEVIKDYWDHDLQYAKAVKPYDGDDLRENRLVYDKKVVADLVKQYEDALLTKDLKQPKDKEELKDRIENFDLEAWLAAVGISLSPESLKELRLHGTSFNPGKKTKGHVSAFQSMFYTNKGEFSLIYKFLRDKVVDATGDVFIDALPLTTESGVHRLAAFEARFNATAHSHSHSSGNKSVFSYADNKFVFDRARQLGAVDENVDIKLLNQLAGSSFAGKHSWDLKQLLKYDDVKQEFLRDENGNVILDKDGDFAKNYEVSYTSLSALIEKGVPTAEKNALEDQDPKQHEVAKFIAFQNHGITGAFKLRRAQLFHMTLSNKNTMVLFNKSIPPITLTPDGKLSNATVDLLFENAVMPEVQRMLDYNDKHNIAGYEHGYKLFYIFPELNTKAELFNVNEATGERTLKPDAHTNPTTKTIIKNVIRAAVDKEVKYKIQEWEDLGMLRRNKAGKATQLHYLDGKYHKWVLDKIKDTRKANEEQHANVDEVANYAATEMAVTYLLHNVGLFQLITTDPATQFKFKGNPLTGDPLAQVAETFDNVSKRLGGEISPGRDLATHTNASYKLGVIADINLPSLAYKKYQEIFKKDPEKAKAYARINIADATELTTLPESLQFMKETAKLTPEQIKQLDDIIEKYDEGIKATKAGKDASKYDLDLAELKLILQVQKPIMVGTRVDNNVETKLYVKSAAFTLIPQFVRGTELEKLMLLMEDNSIQRLAMESAVKLGAPRNVKAVFDDNGNFKPEVILDPTKDIFTVPRKFLRLQQETPYKNFTAISRVSQASKQAFLNIMDVKGFKLPGVEKELTGRQLYEKHYLPQYEYLYKSSYDNLLKDLNATVEVDGRISVSPKQINKLIQDELVTRGYPIHDLEALDIEQQESGEWRFKMPIWAAAKSGKLEAFLNSIVSNRILKQKFNGYSFVLASEVGFKFNPATTVAQDKSIKESEKKGVGTSVRNLSEELKNKILFTDKFEIELKPAALNNGFHQVILPWKFKEKFSAYIDPKTQRLDTTKFDPELLKLFGMRIPNQGPNSTAALEVVGFFPPEAGDAIIAPRDFVKQMGSDFDIDKLYTYMYHYKADEDGKLVRNDAVKEGEKNSRESAQNRILDIHLAINTHDKTQAQILTPLDTLDLKGIADSIQGVLQSRAKAEAATSNRVSIHDLSQASGSYQSYKYQSSVIASKAISAFAVQNTFNGVAQTVKEGLSMVKFWPKDGSPIVYSHISFGGEHFQGKNNLSHLTSLRTNTFISTHISAMLSAALDDEKEQILGRIHVNDKNLSVVNFLLQAGFELNTIANFISQDIVVEYTKQLAIHNNNAQRALNAVMSQKRFAFDDINFQNRGLEPGEKSPSKKPKRITREEVEANPDKYSEYFDFNDSREGNPVQNKFWKLYNSSAEQMFEYIADGEKAIDYKYAQYALLQKFIDLHQNEARTLRSLQSMSNVDSKGVGANMFESILQQQNIEKLGDPQGIKIENAGKLFGDFKGKLQHAHEEEDLLKKGYIKGTNFYFKPTSIPGLAFGYGIMTNNKLWEKHFPYNTDSILLTIQEISDAMSSSSDTLFSKAAQYRKIFREIKNYVYTDNAVTAGNIEELRKEFLYDYVTKAATRTTAEVKHLSLGSILYAAKRNPLTSELFRNNSFLNNLYVKAQPDQSKPKVIMFRQPPDDETTNRDIFNDVENLIINPTSLGEYNGVQYDTRMFIEHLLLAANVSMTSVPQMNLLQYIPTRLLTQAGIAESLHKYDWSKIAVEPGIPSAMATQYFQHLPQLTPTVDLKEVENIEYGYEELTEKEINAGIDQDIVYDSALKHPGNILKFTQEVVEEPAPFMHAVVGSKTLLFKLTDKSTNEYSRIPVLLNSGSSNSHEYNANVDVARSLYPGNNPPAYTVPVSIPGRMEFPAKQPFTPEELSKKKADQLDQLLGVYGLSNEEYNLTKAELDNVLNVIFSKSTIPGNRLTAAWLRTLITSDKPQFIVNFRMTTDPKAVGQNRGRTAVTNGHIQVYLNPEMVNTSYGKAGLEETILHELVHSVTKLAIMQGRGEITKGNLSHQQRRAYRNLEKLYKLYKAKYQTGKQGQDLYESMKDGVMSKKDYVAFYDYVYPGKNLEEFVVGIMQRPALRARLNELVYDEESGQTFWERIQEIFKYLLDALGVDVNSTSGKAIRDILFISEQGNTVFQDPGLSIPLEILPDDMQPKPEPTKGQRSFEKRYTPDEVTTLADDEVFVFGSNPQGINGNPEKGSGGTALVALKAGWVKQGEKLDNRMSESQKAFGITTVTAPGKKRSKKTGEIINGIREMFAAARSLPKKKFLVTKIATGNAGYEVSEIKALFERLENEIPDNVILPFEFDPRPDPELSLHQTGTGMDWEAYNKMQQIKEDQEEATPKKAAAGEILPDGSQHMTSEELDKLMGLSDMPAFYGTTSRRKRGQRKKVSANLEKVNALLAVHRSTINQLWKREKDIRTELEENTNLTKEQRLALHKRRVKVFTHIEEVSAEILKVAAIANTADLVKHGEIELDKILRQLADVNRLDYRDFHILTLKLNVWKDAEKHFLSAAEQEIPAIAGLFANIVSRAKSAEKILLNAQQKMVLEWSQGVAKKQITPQSMWQASKDISWASGLTLSLDNANHPLLQVTHQHIKRAESFAREEYNKIKDEITRLVTAVKNKEAITGKNFSNFFETDADGNITGNLVRMFSPAYLADKNRLSGAVAAYRELGDRPKTLAARKKLTEFIKKHEVFFDVRKLVSLPGYEKHFTDNNGKLEAELKSILGEEVYQEYLDEAIKKFQEYEIQAELKKQEFEEDHPDDPIKAASKYDIWLSYNSLPAYLDYVQDPAAKYGKAAQGYANSVHVPRAKNDAGESLYNEKYLALQQDPDVAALHRFTTQLLDKLRSYMPSNRKHEFDSGALPAIEKGSWETLKTEGMVAAGISLLDKLNMGLTSADTSELLYGADESGRSLTVKMQTLQAEIKKIVAAKKKEYLRKNDKPADEATVAEFRKEAAAQVRHENSTDLLYMLATYAGAIVSYHHKSKIEDVVRIAEQLFVNGVKDPVTTADGMPKMRVFPGGVTIPEFKRVGHANQKIMLENALDRFWNLPKNVEGISKTKLYTHEEKKSLKALQEEVKTYTAEIEALSAELEQLKNSSEGLTAEQAEAEVKKVAAIQNKLTLVKGKLDDVNLLVKQLGQNLSTSGAVNTLLQYLVVKGLGWNIFGGLTNLGVGTMSNMIEAAGGRWFNEKEMLGAYRIVLNSTVKSGSLGAVATDTSKKLTKLMKEWDILKTITQDQFRTPSPAENALQVLHWSQVYKTTEFVNQAPILVAMMKHYKIKDLTGKELSLWEAYGKTGTWNTEQFGDIDAVFDINKRADFKASVDKAIRYTHGNYDPASEIAAKNYSLGKLLTVFRNWMFEGFKSRWDKEGSDVVDDFERKGRYWSYKGSSLSLGLAGIGTMIMPGFGSAIGFGVGLAIGAKTKDSKRFKPEFSNMSAFDELAWTTKYLVRKLSFGALFGKVNLEERFTETDARNLRKNMTEISFLLYVSGLMMVLRHLTDGEDDDDKKALLMYNLNILHRLQQDLGFYANPISTQAILKDPIPAVGIITDSFNLIKHAAGYIADPESDIVPTGRFAGESKLERSIYKTIPGARIIPVTKNLSEQELPSY